MSEQDFSPEPFGVREYADEFVICDRFGDRIGVLPRRTGDHLEPEQVANLALFLAAPDMLRALKLILTEKPKRGRPADIAQMAAWGTVEACIAKAERRA